MKMMKIYTNMLSHLISLVFVKHGEILYHNLTTFLVVIRLILQFAKSVTKRVGALVVLQFL